MSRFTKSQVEFGVVDIYTHIKFQGRTDIVDQGLNVDIHRSGIAQGGGPNYVPDMHLIIPIDSQWTFGFGITTPFGLETNYSANSFVADAATETQIQTINFNPSLAYKVNKTVSLGFGLDVEQATGKFNQQIYVPYGVITPNSVTQTVQNKLEDWATGWNAGVLINLDESSRVGLAYRSKIVHHAKGTSDATATFAGGTSYHSSNGDTKATIPTPATTILSVAHDVNQQWTVMASAFYTQWRAVKEITLDNVQVSPEAGAVPGLVRDVTLPENFRNTWNFALGSDYHFTKAWSVQTGLGYDQSPVNDKDRDIRLPDSDRRIVSAGFAYQPIDNLKVNVGYAHYFSHAAAINHTAESIVIKPNLTPINITESGTSFASADVFGLAVNYKF